jgi:hypothetical protein
MSGTVVVDDVAATVVDEVSPTVVVDALNVVDVLSGSETSEVVVDSGTEVSTSSVDDVLESDTSKLLTDSRWDSAFVAAHAVPPDSTAMSATDTTFNARMRPIICGPLVSTHPRYRPLRAPT